MDGNLGKITPNMPLYHPDSKYQLSTVGIEISSRNRYFVNMDIDFQGGSILYHQLGTKISISV